MRKRPLSYCRSFSGKMILLGVLIAVALFFMLFNTSSDAYKKKYEAYNNILKLDAKSLSEKRRNYLYSDNHIPDYEVCKPLYETHADIDTVTTFDGFDFNPIWTTTGEFWGEFLENRYEKIKASEYPPPLRVFVVPHSHNDPGWLTTYEQYFEKKTKNIINNIISQLIELKNMTFIWNEVSFLSMWWDRTHPSRQKFLKKLIDEGRLEITTGGWVMPDEATTHVYALVDQLIEGHQWLNMTLGIKPKTGWSIDPFGHGPTVPHLLEESGIKGTIIQRIHYAWKNWFAVNKIEDFYWVSGYKKDNKPTLIVHNQPFDIYSIKSSCGPHPIVCLEYDFRQVRGEFSESSIRTQPITHKNIRAKAQALYEEYERTGSLTPHNVVLIPLGDDFRYEHEIEFKQQYDNYLKIFDYINNHTSYKALVTFGTPKEYFDEIVKRWRLFPKLKGDFFVYSDIFTEAKPAYWSGYYTTRPFIKIMAREVEHHLRNAEILYTFALNRLKQKQESSWHPIVRKLEMNYENIINARRNLGLFQHHDAITGTSKAYVMEDYGNRLHRSMFECIKIQELSLNFLLVEPLPVLNLIQSELELEDYGVLPKKTILKIIDSKTVILFNSLSHLRAEVVTVSVATPNVAIYNRASKEYVPHQVNPRILINFEGLPYISNDTFDVLFVAKLPALSVVTYNIEITDDKTSYAQVYCRTCNPKTAQNNSPLFPTQSMMQGDIILENKAMKLTIGRNSGFLASVYRKEYKKRNLCEINFGAYNSAQSHSGAYLFAPSHSNPEKDILKEYLPKPIDDNIIIITGPLTTEVNVYYPPFLQQRTRIYNIDDLSLSEAIYLETIVDFESPPKNRETELFMRINTDIQNGNKPEYYTDQNGFQYQKRIRVDNLGIEGNYYPITTMAFLQDRETRFTYITDHAQGVSGIVEGTLEVMLDRRMLYDDHRGMGEGIVDNKVTVFRNWIMFEKVDQLKELVLPKTEFKLRKDQMYEMPSFHANYLSRILNYPINIMHYDNIDKFVLKEFESMVNFFPSALHMMTLRTLTESTYDELPSKSALMVLQHQGYSCYVGTSKNLDFSITTDMSDVRFTDLRFKVTSTSLTGNENYKLLHDTGDIKMKQMEIKTYRIDF